MPNKVEKLNSSTFETIDASVLAWVDNTMNIFATTNDGWKKVPVFWMTAERAAQRQRRRDTFSDALVFPMISVERTKITKAAANERPIPAHIFPSKDGTSFSISKRINQSKTKSFANADALRLHKQLNFPRKNEKIVYQSRTIPLPIFHNVEYVINLRSDYQQQMNEMVQPFMTFAGNINQFLVEKDGHKYEAFIDINYAFSNNMSTLAGAEKLYETTISLKVLGYVFGADKNQEGPTVSYKENAVEIKIQRERVILGDINEFNEKEGYRR